MLALFLKSCSFFLFSLLFPLSIPTKIGERKSGVAIVPTNMVSGPELHTFFGNFHTGISLSLNHVIQDVVREFLQSQRPQLPRHSPPCLLQEMGDFLMSVLEALSHLVKVIVRETYIPQHIRRRLSIQVEEDDLTDLSNAKYMDKKYDALMYGLLSISSNDQHLSTKHKSGPLETTLRQRLLGLLRFGTESKATTASTCQSLIACAGPAAHTVGQQRGLTARLRDCKLQFRLAQP